MIEKEQCFKAIVDIVKHSIMFVFGILLVAYLLFLIRLPKTFDFQTDLLILICYHTTSFNDKLIIYFLHCVFFCFVVFTEAFLWFRDTVGQKGI